MPSMTSAWLSGTSSKISAKKHMAHYQWLDVKMIMKWADLLGLAPGCKDVLLETRCNECFEMLGVGITLASLPPSYCVPGDPKTPGQSCLREPDRHPQCQHPLTEGIVLLSIQSSLRESSPFRTTHPNTATPGDGRLAGT